MGTSLNGTTPSVSYTGLLKFGDNTEITSSLKAISDGAGNDTMLELSTTALQIGGSTGAFWDNTNKRLGVGINTPTARLHVKSSGTTSATTALLLQNSAGTDIVSVKDDLSVVFNSTITSASGTLRFDIGGVGTIRMSSDKVGIGGNVSPTARLHVKGSGTTLATTALLVQNSAGTDIVSVKDDLSGIFAGIITFENNVGLRGANFTQSNLNMRFVVPGATKTFLINADYSNTNEASALLEVQSTTKGFLPPKMTTTQKNAISSPASGLMVYDTDTNKLCCYNGTSWNDLF
jgi:uncharacterized protein YxjI